ncbi:hypothetical protein NDK47_26840 [Brevibacillus ruminantium]|uniref:Type VI secretion system spike protein VgrG3-like C-terminal domain-containing protein n=1 Tax=Brevibacillus ruminantium TaxID=2950604 RepID=A0ABY4WI20_9BACL|nr:hypothetical protein [Brevibacillus ruminantium]USG65672.1 hypothetical protein NDK47_26840 [Brevibacillus ruminantium]
MQRFFFAKATVITLTALISLTQTFHAVKAEGIHAQGIHADGINTQGIQTQGISTQGIGTQGINKQGIDAKGISPDGVNAEGINNKGINPDGINAKGIQANEINATGIKNNGVSPDGIKADGIQNGGINPGGIKNGGGQPSQNPASDPNKNGNGQKETPAPTKPKDNTSASPKPNQDTKPKTETKPNETKPKDTKPGTDKKDNQSPPPSKDKNQPNAGTKLGSLSAAYESNGNPGTISTGKGDIGGKSYGAYQFNSKDKVIDHFFRWLEGKDKDIYNQLLAGFNADGKKIGSSFDQKFKEVAANDSDRFLELQHLYTKEKYYDVVDRALQKDIGFDISQRSAALQDVLWSRAVQHGGAGGAKVFKEALKNLDLATATDEDIIRAVYKESGKVVDSGKNQMLSQKAKTNGVHGKYMKYFSGNSSDIQMGVWERLNIREPEAALKMLYGKDYVFKGL